MWHYVTVDLNKGINIIKQKKLKRNVMSVIEALFYMLQVEVHLRMREICQQICVTQKKKFLYATFNQYLLFHSDYRKKICKKKKLYQLLY